MNIFSTIFVAFGLSMDAFAVSVTDGIIANKSLKFKRALIISILFGAFQAIMPIIGFFGGMTIKDFIKDWDHWVAFSILCYLGSKMIYNSYLEKGKCQGEKNLPNYFIVLSLAVATSIDALAAGLSMSLISKHIFLPSLIIGFITFFMSMLGVKLGNKYGSFFSNKCEIAGGVMLCLIGLKILIEHLFGINFII